MYSMKKTDYGFRLVFGDFMEGAEMGKWVEEARAALESAPKEFFVFVDMRTLKPLPRDAQEKMEEGQKLFKAKGMLRSVVILNNTMTKIQFKRIAQETGIYAWERYIDASTSEDWEKKGLDWLLRSVDPDS